MTDWRVRGFREVRELGRGGQGRVVLARHETRGTPVAIKYLPAGAGEAAQERLRHEAKMLGRVENPHVARLYRLVESEHGTAILMEAVNGVPFREILRRHGTLGPEAALTVLKGSLLGLAAAHEAGVVHRDYKPANVIVPADGRSKLIDFGIATAAGSASAEGTPPYMAPEQWRREPSSPATDVYAATCVFFESVTGRRPYPARGMAALRTAHMSEPVPVEKVPEALRPLIARGMAKAPEERPASAAEFVGELDDVARSAYGPDWESRGVRALAATAVALAALFPLAAAGLGSASASAGAVAGSSGAVATLGAKTTAVVAGTAVAGAAAGGAGVYQATQEEDPPRRPAAVSAPASPAGKTVTVGRLTLVVPPSWRVQRIPAVPRSGDDSGPGDGYFVSSGRPCLGMPSGYTPVLPGHASDCPGFFVLASDFLTNPSRYIAGPYKTGDTYASLFGQDEGLSCPGRDELRAVGVRHGATLQTARPAAIGPRTANFRQWRVPCYTRGGIDEYGPTDRTGFSFLELHWHLPESRILVVDLWATPGLAGILAKAGWR
ncbi:serine/threonine-protein kinase [Actinomadura sp. 9N407]|uniref:serine/threonine-protein kinase n=1 Tax=Actinomadura sp. 9N407 TaxID=3375154 RepID=UPI00379FBFE6